MIEGYSPWHTDENKRYCLMDTMDIVAVYRKVPDIVEGVRAVLEGITLVIIPNVVAESASVCKELSGKEWDDLKTLESDIEEGVRELGVPVEFAFPPDGVLSEATARYSNADSDGAGLSLVDTILLCIAARMANVDVMTEDKAVGRLLPVRFQRRQGVQVLVHRQPLRGRAGRRPGKGRGVEIPRHHAPERAQQAVGIGQVVRQ